MKCAFRAGKGTGAGPPGDLVFLFLLPGAIARGVECFPLDAATAANFREQCGTLQGQSVTPKQTRLSFVICVQGSRWGQQGTVGLDPAPARLRPRLTVWPEMWLSTWQPLPRPLPGVHSPVETGHRHIKMVHHAVSWGKSISEAGRQIQSSEDNMCLTSSRSCRKARSVCK